MYQITVDDILVDVIRKKIKNLHLTICPPAGRIRISAPIKMNEDDLRRFIISKLEWIRKHKSKFVARAIYHYAQGEIHFYQGERYFLNVIHKTGREKVVVSDVGILDLYVAKESCVVKRERVLYRWYRQQLEKQIPTLVDKWQKVIGIEIAEWRVKKMKTRWGTCNIIARRIWLNVELAKKSLHCLEYIIVHEMVHLLERHHNRRFKAYMDKFMPCWRSYKKELNC